MDIRQVTETIAMIEEQNFDIRTITMGISLLDCIDPDIDKAADKIYEKITRYMFSCCCNLRIRFRFC